MDSLDGYVSDDDLAIGPLEDLGWDVVTVSWRDEQTEWSDFAAVVIRTTWDYQRNPEKFLVVLSRIEASAAHLENQIDIVKWNLSKEYLLEMDARGIPIVPTLWAERYDAESFDRWLDRLGSNEVIVKPVISATAEHTYRLKSYDPELRKVFGQRGFMVQPFLGSVVSEGEFSLCYFDGEFSHAILKQPVPGDFRVQEEHGGTITAITPDPALFAAGQKAVDQVKPTPLYARVDLVRGPDSKLLLIELELIEPSLYLRMDKNAPVRFAEALDRRVGKSNGRAI